MTWPICHRVRRRARRRNPGLRKAIEIQIRSGHPDRVAIENLVKRGQADPERSEQRHRDPKDESTGARRARQLHLDQGLNVYADADQKERPLLRPIIGRKTSDIQKEADPKRPAALRGCPAERHAQGTGSPGFRIETQCYECRDEVSAICSRWPHSSARERASTEQRRACRRPSPQRYLGAAT